jgi:PAS domain-containing protein
MSENPIPAQRPVDQEFTNSLIRAIYNVSPDGILVVNEAGEVVSLNKRFLQVWQIPIRPEDEKTDAFVGDPDNFLAQGVAKVKDPAGFLSRVHELYQNPDAEDNSEIELKDDRVLERYSKVLRAQTGQSMGRV